MCAQVFRKCLLTPDALPDVIRFHGVVSATVDHVVQPFRVRAQEPVHLGQGQPLQVGHQGKAAGEKKRFGLCSDPGNDTDGQRSEKAFFFT